MVAGKGAIQAGEGVIKTSWGCRANMPGKGTIRARQDI